MTSNTGITKAKRELPPEIQAKIEDARVRNAMVAAVRGTQWGRDCSAQVQHAVAHYCYINGLDAVRHVEVLGGRIYLTAEFYRERGAPLLRSGEVVPLATDFVQADARLDELAEKAPDSDTREWAAQERARRMRERIRLGIPDAATGAAIVRLRLRASGEIVEGFNFCGGGTKKKIGKGGTLYDADPIGDFLCLLDVMGGQDDGDT